MATNDRLIVSVLASDDLVGKVNAVFKCRCLKRFQSWFRSTFHWASSLGVCGRLSRSLGELEVLPSLYRGWFTELKMYRHSCLCLVCVNGEMGLVSGLSIWFYCFFFYVRITALSLVDLLHLLGYWRRQLHFCQFLSLLFLAAFLKQITALQYNGNVPTRVVYQWDATWECCEFS